jgi:hypothetical protein
VTVRTAPLLTAPEVAAIVAEPMEAVVAMPAEFTTAMPGTEELHVTEEVTSAMVPSV